MSEGSGAKSDETAVELLEHARPDLGVAEEVDLAVGADRPGLHLADVVEERRPPDLEPLGRLPHDLLGVLPDVLVPPLAVAEADHRVDLGEDCREGAVEEERVEPELGIVSHHDAVEARAERGGVELRRGDEVFAAGEAREIARHDPSLGRRGCLLECVERKVARCGG